MAHRLALLERDNNISAIVAQIEIEKTAERAQQRKKTGKRELTTAEPPHISQTGVDHDEDGKNTSTDTNTARKSSNPRKEALRIFPC